MAIIHARQKMTVTHSEGETTIFPFDHPQILPDAMLEHEHVKGAIRSGWVTVIPIENTEPEVEPAKETPAPKKRRS